MKPKETRRVEVQYKTWRGKVTNFRNKPAFISSNDNYGETTLHIEEINTTPQHSKMQVNVTNIGKEGMQIPRNARIAKLELLDSILQRTQEQDTAQAEMDALETTTQNEPNQNEITDVKECDTCMCRIPNKLVFTDVNGNNNHGLPHENINLIHYRSELKDKKSGLYIKHSTDPFVRTVSLCPDGKGMTDIKSDVISEMVKQFSNTTNRVYSNFSEF